MRSAYIIRSRSVSRIYNPLKSTHLTSMLAELSEQPHAYIIGGSIVDTELTILVLMELLKDSYLIERFEVEMLRT